MQPSQITAERARAPRVGASRIAILQQRVADYKAGEPRTPQHEEPCRAQRTIDQATSAKQAWKCQKIRNQGERRKGVSNRDDEDRARSQDDELRE